MTDCIKTTSEARWLSGLVVLTLASNAVAIVVGTVANIPMGEFYRGYFLAADKMALPAMLFFAIPISIGAMLRRVEHPFRALRNYMAGRFGSLDEAIGTLLPVPLMILMLAAVGIMKQIMPLVAPFSWDDTFANAGRFLLFGHQAWQITHALFGSPRDTQIINFIYFLWLPFLFFSVLGFATIAPRYTRARFFVTFGAAWLLLGVVAAFLLSSAGPCYASLIGTSSEAHFAPLMARLRTMDTSGYPIGALRWQTELWQHEVSHRYGLGLGISAMPSMHNSIAFLYVLATRRSSSFLRWAAWLFAVAILVGSVHLGWHYLADGLFAWVAVAAIWWGAGAYLRWCGYAIEEPTPSKDIAGSINDVHHPLSI